MGTIHLRELDEDNLDLVIKLSDTLTEEQRKCVAPNIYSIAEAYVYPGIAWPRAIYLDDEPIGFVMLSLKPDEVKEEDLPAYYLWRFMIAKDHQRNGYGKQVLDLLVAKCKAEGIKTLYTSCDITGDQPYQFYIRYGFVDTLENDGEQILKIAIH